MSTKNFGPSVSGYLDPSGRNWETVVFGAGKPVLDKELNLGQDLRGPSGALSGWISDDVLGSAAGNLTALFTGGAAGNLVTTPVLRAQVNGWSILVTNSDAVGDNLLTFPVAPMGAGVRRTDLVVLEVWRRLLAPSPSTGGKSTLGRIWANGNVRVPAGSDAGLNYDDDLLDVMLGAESTKRVQIQYRLRVVSGIDVFAHPYGMTDPTVVANSVPAAPGAPDGVATLWTYANQSGAGDAGLWRAGDGDPANSLGTVDGYMYALPLMAVFRRNRTAFAKLTNHNGGVASPGPSDRPDGLFHDVIVTDDIADLRAVSGKWDYTEVLDKTLTYLLDNTLRSEWETTLNGGGVCGHTPLYACELGSDTAGADLIGDFDATRRDFTDRPIVETMTLQLHPVVSWDVDGGFVVDPTALPIYPYGTFNWAAFNDPRVQIIGISRARWLATAAGGAGNTVSDDALPYIMSVTGLGAQPLTTLTATFGLGLPPGSLTAPLYVDVIVAYPPGLGLTRTPVGDCGTTTFLIDNPAQLPAGAPISCDPAQLTALGADTYFHPAISTSALDYPHRGLRLVYRTSNLVFESCAPINPSQEIPLPERASSIVSVEKDSGGGYVALVNPITLSDDGRLITVSLADISAPFDKWRVTYKALRPLPQNAVQMTAFFKTRAPQTARSALLGLSKTVVPRLISKNLYAITAGSGSSDEGYPFPQAYVQTGGIFPSTLGTFDGEHELQGGAEISTASFSASTGMLSLPTYVGYTPNPEEVTFNRDLTDIDAENRSFFKSAPLGYQPNAYAQALSDRKRHKNVLPFLAELPADSTLGVKGQLVLVLLVRWALSDGVNSVVFDPDLTSSTSSASIFRLRNLLLNAPRP